MHLKTITGKTKDSLRITKPIGGLLIVTDQLLAGMTGELAGVSNEEVNIQIESGQNQVKIIQPKQKLGQLALMSTVGEGGMLVDGGRIFMHIPFSDEGSLAIANNEEIAVSFDTMKSAKTYEVYGIETPGLTRKYFEYSFSKVLAGRVSETLNVREADLVLISKIAAVKNLEFTKITAMPDGELEATNHEFTSDEIKFLISQTNDIVAASKDASVLHAYFHDALVFPSDLLTQMEIETDGTELDIILRKPMLF